MFALSSLSGKHWHYISYSIFKHIGFPSTAVNVFISELYRLTVGTRQSGTLLYCLIVIIVAELWNTLATPDIELRTIHIGHSIYYFEGGLVIMSGLFIEACYIFIVIHSTPVRRRCLEV